MGHKDLGKRKYNPSLAHQQTKEGKAYLKHILAMEPYERFLYWIRERQAIHCNRWPKGFSIATSPIGRASPSSVRSKELPENPPPWTEDPIFQTVFFCNVYRENDRVTTALREMFRSPYGDEVCALLGTIVLRWYNYVPTFTRLINAKIPQRLAGKQAPKAIDEACKLLVDLRDNYKEQLFGGAYIIRPIVDGKAGARKVESLTELFHSLHEDKELYDDLCSGSMQDAFDRLRGFSGMGQFYVYQFIGDLAYTHILRDAEDWFTWSYCGPGTARGLLRLQHESGSLTAAELPRMMKAPRDAEEQLLALQARVNKDLKLGSFKAAHKQPGCVNKMIPIHMRDLTNCLCEYDKYERSLFNERSIKRPYKGY